MTRVLLPIQHNWVETIERRLTWPTAITQTTDGREQRIAQRAPDDPGEQLVVTLTALRPTSAARIRRAILVATDRAVWCPRWYDAVQLSEGAAAGAGELALVPGYLAGDRDFAAGGSAVLWRTDPATGAPSQTEIVTVDSVTNGAAVLSGATALAWPAGSWLVPLLAGVLEPEVEGDLPNGATGQWRLTVTADSETVGSLDADEDALVPAVAGAIEPDSPYIGTDYVRGHQYQWRRVVVRDANGVVLPYVTVEWSTDLPEYVLVTPLPDSQRARIDVLPTLPNAMDCNIYATVDGLTATISGGVFPDWGTS